MNSEILDLDAAAEFLGIKKRTMYKLVNDGEIPGVKIGGQWRFSREQLIQLFRSDPTPDVSSNIKNNSNPK